MVKTLFPSDIHLVIQEISGRIQTALDADAILLAGSFGKDAWLFSEQKLLSDFEFVFVRKSRWSISAKNQLLKDLNKEFPYEISLKGYLYDKAINKCDSNYSRKYPGYVRLDFFDTFSNPKILYSSGVSFKNIEFKDSDITSWEAWRLIVNRIGDLLDLESKTLQDEGKVSYCWLKIFESIADAFLINQNKYHKNISRRLESFSKELVYNDEEIDELCKESYDCIQSALISRDRHDMKFFENIKSISLRRKVLLNWLDYFQGQLSKDEQFDQQSDFYQSYLKNKNLQKKYLENPGFFSVYISNLIRIFRNRELVQNGFKYRNMSTSWRHMSLLAISSLFHESETASTNYAKTRIIADNLFDSEDMNSNDLRENVIYYWKRLR